jgi:ketosteroid isomerase-like protein
VKEELIMDMNTISRRNLLAAGTCALVGTSSLLNTASLLAQQHAVSRQQGQSNMTKEELIRTYYSGYEKKDWSLSGGVLADDFTFTSPNDDDHISKSVFIEKCFASQFEFIERFELETVLTRGNEAFVKYLCRTNGTPFRNVEYFRFAGGKITAIEAYFGGKVGYPGASVVGRR